jgi:glycosyltransferase involved in cell wall biosynthesis
MPVADRREYLPGAVACYLSQDYANRELIVIDNGQQDIYDLVAGVPGLIYRRISPGPAVGALRNLACELARGEYIAHWDSDDWYAPDRLSAQLRVLRQSGRPATGYNLLPFADDRLRRAWMFERYGSPYACGTSLVYVRSFWAAHRFAPFVRYGEDNHFIERMEGRLLPDSGRSIVARVHDQGTSPRDLTGWKEIDYAGLAVIGYPVTEVKHEEMAPAGKSEPEDLDNRDTEGGRGRLVSVVAQADDYSGATHATGGADTSRLTPDRYQRPAHGRRKRRNTGVGS